MDPAIDHRQATGEYCPAPRATGADRSRESAARRAGCDRRCTPARSSRAETDILETGATARRASASHTTALARGAAKNVRSSGPTGRARAPFPGGGAFEARATAPVNLAHPIPDGSLQQAERL